MFQHYALSSYAITCALLRILIPAIEMEWYGNAHFGRIHGVMMIIIIIIIITIIITIMIMLMIMMIIIVIMILIIMIIITGVMMLSACAGVSMLRLEALSPKP